MDRFARIWTGWLAAGVGGGLVLVVPNWPPHDLLSWAVFAVGAALLLGSIIGLAAELVQRPKTHPEQDKLLVAGHDSTLGSQHIVTHGPDSPAVNVTGSGNTISIGALHGATPKQSRQILTQSAGTLAANYKSHTSAQAASLLEPYIDKWMTVAGTVIDVERGNPDWNVQLHSSDDQDADLSLIALTFTNPEQIELVRVLGKGERVVVQGRLRAVSRWWVRLVDCEIVSGG